MFDLGKYPVLKEKNLVSFTQSAGMVNFTVKSYDPVTGELTSSDFSIGKGDVVIQRNNMNTEYLNLKTALEGVNALLDDIEGSSEK